MRRSARRTPSRPSPEDDYVPAEATGGDPSEEFHDAEGDAALDELLASSGEDCTRIAPKTPQSAAKPSDMGGDTMAAAANVEEVLSLRAEVADLRKQLAAKEEELNDVSSTAALAEAELQAVLSQKAAAEKELAVYMYHPPSSASEFDFARCERILRANSTRLNFSLACAAPVALSQRLAWPPRRFQRAKSDGNETHR